MLYAACCCWCVEAGKSKVDLKSVILFFLGKKFCVIKDGMFYLFEKSSSKKPTGSFPLQGRLRQHSGLYLGFGVVRVGVRVTVKDSVRINTLCLKIGCQFYFGNNFGKCRPILIILSLLNSQIYYGGSLDQNDHLTSSLLPHYLGKLEFATYNVPLILAKIVRSASEVRLRFMMINLQMVSVSWTSFFTYLLFPLVVDVIMMSL